MNRALCQDERHVICYGGLSGGRPGVRGQLPLPHSPPPSGFAHAPKSMTLNAYLAQHRQRSTFSALAEFLFHTSNVDWISMFMQPFGPC